MRQVERLSDTECGVLRNLNFDIYPTRKFEFHKGIYGLGRSRKDVNKALVAAGLKLFAALLIHVWRAQNRMNLLIGGERNWTAYNSTCSFYRFDNLFGALVNQRMVVRL